MKLFISGGAKNGKSFYAQKRAKDLASAWSLPLYYVATMIPHDEEDRARIARHLKEREGWGFETIEKPFGLRELMSDSAQINPNGVFLVDSVTAILSNAMFPAEPMEFSENVRFGFDECAAKVVAEDLLGFSNKAENVIFVSDYIYADPPIVNRHQSQQQDGALQLKDAVSQPKDAVGQQRKDATQEQNASGQLHDHENQEQAAGFDDKDKEEIDYTEVYRRGLAYVDRKLAEACDEVIEITAGIAIRHK